MAAAERASCEALPVTRRAIVLRVIAGLLAVVLSSCALLEVAWNTEPLVYDSTYSRVLARARSGDAESQNALGFMLFYGEGVAPDRIEAHLWFRRAAEQGNLRARRNLQAMAAFGPEVYAPSFSPVPREPAYDVPDAEHFYLKFCSGCHGVNGVAAYENSPSFAFAERLEKSDAVLMRSLLNGMQEMPGWEGKLPRETLHAILGFVRTLPARYDTGISGPLRAAPSRFYLFGPMEQRRREGML